MIRPSALLVALLLALGAATAPRAAARGAPTPRPASDDAAREGRAGKELSKPLDINSASEKDLQQLPGIGEALSRKIVENRPYARTDELVRKKVIPRATYDKIKDRIVAASAR
jgi:DNA uptake protein ComE-like DNA-binding protein